MKVLYYCYKPSILQGVMHGGNRMAGAYLHAILSEGVEVLAVDETTYDSRSAFQFESSVDIIHCDSTKILKDMLKRNRKPDVVGPLAWGILKKIHGKKFIEYNGYEDNKEQIYDDIVWIRNNFQEETPCVRNKIRIIKSSVECDLFQPNYNSWIDRNLVLWAGDKNRPVKNYDLFEKLQQISLPASFRWHVIFNYNLQDYLDILDKSILVINTSYHESFCFQLFEAWSKGVPSIQRKNLWGQDFFVPVVDLSVDYSAEKYAQKISEYLTNINEESWMQQSQKLRHMIETEFSPCGFANKIIEVYKEIIDKRNCYQI